MNNAATKSAAKTRETLTSTEERIMADAIRPMGAASYLNTAVLAKLAARGLVVQTNEFKFHATDAGRRAFLRA